MKLGRESLDVLFARSITAVMGESGRKDGTYFLG